MRKDNTMTGHSQAMSAERIEKAARALALLAGYGIWPIPEECAAPGGVRRYMCVLRRRAESALRAAYPELADGSSVILPREATEAMLAAAYRAEIKVGGEDICGVMIAPEAEAAWNAMRDAALSAPEST